MKRLTLFMLLLFFISNSEAQKKYTEYYNAKYGVNSYSDTNCTAHEYEDAAIGRLIQAFKFNNPLPYDLLRVSSYYFKINNKKEGEKLLMMAASTGINISSTFFSKFYDSLFLSDEILKINYWKKYKNSLQKCDMVNSIEIIKLLSADQHIRSYFRQYEDDKSFKSFKWKEVKKVDSVNYFTLLSIMNTSDFNAKKLSFEAQEDLGILLTHSLTNDYVNPDTVIAILKNEMLNGVFDPTFCANAIDRYYANKKGMNYYCNFYIDELPIFDVANLDKRRSELFLYPLYLKFKWNNRLNKLPQEYKYDINSIK